MTDMHTQHNLNKIKEIVFSNEMMSFEKKQFLKNNSYTFMKNAGRMVFQFIRKKFDNNQPIIVLCGPGNNGGDGFVIAKTMATQLMFIFYLTNKIIKEMPLQL